MANEKLGGESMPSACKNHAKPSKGWGKWSEQLGKEWKARSRLRQLGRPHRIL